MAQVSFTKLNLKPSNEIKTFVWNEQSIEIKTYLPIEEKMAALTSILDASANDVGYYNPAKVAVFTTLEIIYRYTNIKFTDKQKEDAQKLYDSVISTGFYEELCNNIETSELAWFKNYVETSIAQIYEYRNSVMGIIEAVNQDYSNLNLDAENIQKNLADPNNLTLLKDVVTKLG